ncbi:HNH endonuclease signature motif containing protein [Isoptericola sp. AK164]|uniref:HNH endonuclease signature motif containing protein n=1 Tax=Isoptericola sp. AK164 TaxID=3024246 RepID=UPI0024189DD5|nr:HNH endonuclease signature motif containing protein [Isoptericola sp. AK164]
MTQMSDQPWGASPDQMLAALRRATQRAVASLDAVGSADEHPADLDATLDAVEAVQAAVNTLEGLRAVLADRLRRQADRSPGSLVDTEDAIARRADAGRQRELALRAVTADLATSLHVGDGAARRLLDHATTLTTVAPRTVRAVVDGTVSWPKAEILAREIDDLTVAEAAHVEARVLPVAATSTPAQLRSRARRAREEAHPVPADVRHAEETSRREVWLDPGRDGMAWLTAHLPAPFAHAVHDRLTSTATRLRSEGDDRSTGQLRADVLADLLLDDGTLDRGVLGADDLVGSVGAPRPEEAPGPSAAGTPPVRPVGALAPIARAIRPRVHLTVPVLSLLGVGDAPASLDGRTPVDAETARALCAHAPSFRRILTDPETGAVLSVGRSTYQAPADLKAMLAERDATCRFPGCVRPVSGTDLDHTVAWADGGTTGTDNLAHLCRHHHVLKHQTRWRVRQLGAGRLRWTSPTGRVHETVPPLPETTRHRAPPTPPALPAPSRAHETADLGPPPF